MKSEIRPGFPRLGSSNFVRLPLISSAIALNLLLLGQGRLSAQQAPPAPDDPQTWQQNDPYNGQYPQGQQPNYGPSYAQPQGYGQPQGPSPIPGPIPAQVPAQALNTEQLEQLVAPIALYPDTLVAQVLAAATYPAQVVDADHWRQAQGYAVPEAIVEGANAQSWDPSLKALTAFPQLLAEMDQNIRWTIALGNAYYNQPQDVLDVVQVMRQRAQAAGNLQSTPQEAVSYNQGFIQVAPVNPELVYLPAYNPWAVYGQPIQPYRGFSLLGALGSFLGSGAGSGFGSGAVRFGLGIAMAAFNHSPFGWLGWGLDWLAHSLLFHNSNYYSHSTTVADWGLPHGGPRAFSQRASMAYGGGYRPGGGYQRPAGVGNGYDRYGHEGYAGNGYNRSAGQGYSRPLEQSSSRYAAESRLGGGGTGNAYARPSAQAYNRAPESVSRPHQYARAGTTYGGSGGMAYGGYGRGAGANYGAAQGYRAPAAGYQRGDFGERSSGSFAGRGFDGYSGKAEKSGGSHSFGGGHESKAAKAPKAPKAPKMDRGSRGGGHSHGGGHRK